MFKTPLRYPGGKSRVSEYLVSLFPDYDEYREPFLGGGSVFMEALKNNKDAKYWVNDLYYDLYCFWLGMSRMPSAVIKRVIEIKNDFNDGRKMYEWCIKKIEECRSENKYYDIAACFFVLNRITFSGTSLSGGYSDESFRKRFTESSIERLKETGKSLTGMNMFKLTNEDFSLVLSENNPFHEGETEENVFVFLDPPYYSAEDSALYGQNGDKHKGFDHERLKGALDKCRYKWLMTYDDCSYIRELYKDYNVMEFEFAYGMRNAGGGTDMKGKELIISNYDIKKSESIVLF